MYAYKDLLELAGLTTRLYSLISTLHHLPQLPPFDSSDEISLRDVDVKIPASATGTEDAILVHNLNLELKPGEHLLISGPNGIGKTSVARVLAGLWAPSSGKISRPDVPLGRLFIVPQRAYMVVGSLRDQ